MIHLDPFTQLRLQRGCELLAEVGHRADCMGCILSLLAEFELRFRLLGADRFPPRPLHAVPRGDARQLFTNALLDALRLARPEAFADAEAAS